MKSIKHVAETDLALYVSGDLGLFQRAAVHFHIGRCERCSQLVEAYRADRARIKEVAAKNGMSYAAAFEAYARTGRILREEGERRRGGLSGG